MAGFESYHYFIKSIIWILHFFHIYGELFLVRKEYLFKEVLKIHSAGAYRIY